MPNSDTTYGLHNKATRIIYQKVVADDSSTSNVSQSFSGNVENAKAFFLTDDALACCNDNATQIQYAITDDGNGLKWTIAYGIKANESDKSWAKTYSDTKATLVAADNWGKSSLCSGSGVGEKFWVVTDSDSHLF